MMIWGLVEYVARTNVEVVTEAENDGVCETKNGLCSNNGLQTHAQTPFTPYYQRKDSHCMYRGHPCHASCISNPGLPTPRHLLQDWDAC
jgi:hypothetical protein